MSISKGQDGAFNPIGRLTPEAQEILEEEAFKIKLARRTRGQEVNFTPKEMQRLRDMAQTGEQIEIEVEVDGDSNRKQTNPKDAIGCKKAPITTVPLNVMLEVGVAMLEGACKYGRHNYREAGVRASVYLDAVIGRHLAGWWEGEDIDPDSQLSHITKAIAGLTVLRDAMMNENWFDDRPIKVKNQNWVSDLNARTKAILEKYPNPKNPFLAKPYKEPK